eukprot:g1859.t1
MSSRKAGQAASGGKKKRKARGHRQKGAGTVLKSRGEVTRQGLQLKEWQRTPKQLLLEYTQKEKKPKPRYYEARSNNERQHYTQSNDASWQTGRQSSSSSTMSSAGLRYRVVLPHPKEKSKNESFCPKESFHDKTTAEHHAALLALFTIDKTKPWERKLPEPYKSLWLNMTSGQQSKGSKNTKKNNATKTVFQCQFCQKTFKVQFALDTHQKRDHKTELKEQKEQDELEKRNITTTKTKPGKMKRIDDTVNNEDDTGGFGSGFWGSDSIGSHANEKKTTKVQNQKKTAPSLSSNVTKSLSSSSSSTKTLTLDRRFKSKHEANQFFLEKHSQKAARERKRAAREQANPIPRLRMSREMIVYLREVLQIVADQSSTAASSATTNTTNLTKEEKNTNAINKGIDVNHVKSEDTIAKNDPNVFRSATPPAWLTRMILGDRDEGSFVDDNSDNDYASDDGNLKLESIREEIETLTAIYGENAFLNVNGTEEEANDSNKAVVGIAFKMVLDNCDRLKALNLAFEIHLPTYPATQAVSYDLNVIWNKNKKKNAEEKEEKTSESDEYYYEFVKRAIEKALQEFSIEKGLILPPKTNHDLTADNDAQQQGEDSDEGYLFELWDHLKESVVNALQKRTKRGRGKQTNKYKHEHKTTSGHQSKQAKASGSDEGTIKKGNTKQQRNILLNLDAKEKARVEKLRDVLHNENSLWNEHLRTLWRRKLDKTGFNNKRFTKQTRGGRRPSTGKMTTNVPLFGPPEYPPGRSTSKPDKTMLAYRRKLPAHSSRQTIIDTINVYDVVLIAGETGSGKTTQVPQFILEALGEQNCNMLCTQPRRIAACSVAKRVAEERGETLGKNKCSIGYAVRGDTQSCGNSTRLLFVTTGVLLRRLQNDPWLHDITHVFLDEVHERGVDSDFAIAILRDVMIRRNRLAKNSQQRLRIILMSATMNETVFAQYFHGYCTKIASTSGKTTCTTGSVGSNDQDDNGRTHSLEDSWENIIMDGETTSGSNASKKKATGGGGKSSSNFGCPIMRIPGFVHPVEDFFLGDVLSLTEYSPFQDSMEKPNALRRAQRQKTKKDGKKFSTDSSNSSTSTSSTVIKPFDVLDNFGLPNNRCENFEHYTCYGLIASLVVDHIMTKESDPGAVLIFLQGTAEIKQCVRTIQGKLSAAGKKGKALVLELHGSLSPSEQGLVFRPPPSGVRKIVVSTNVAETSVTINDVAFVIDSGRVKEMRFDALNRVSTLVDCFCSRAAAKQRRGRAGRVRPGKCFKLYSRRRHDHFFAAQQEPEIKRTALDRLCLQVLSMPPAVVHQASRESGGKAVESGGKAADQNKSKRSKVKKATNDVQKATNDVRRQSALVVTASDVHKFLGRVLEPPPHEQIEGALEVLRDVGATECTLEQKLTSLGKHLARLPCDVRVGKLLIYGSLLRCTEEALTLAAVMTSRSPFLSSFRDEASELRQKLASNSNSDHVALLRIFDRWQKLKHSRKDQRTFCEKNYLSFIGMMNLNDARRQFRKDLRSVGLEQSSRTVSTSSNISILASASGTGTRIVVGDEFTLQKMRVIRAILCAGLYPNVLHVVFPDQKFIETHSGALAKTAEAREIRYFEHVTPSPEQGKEINEQKKKQEIEETTNAMTTMNFSSKGRKKKRDWTCLACGKVVFGTRSECFSCGTMRGLTGQEGYVFKQMVRERVFMHPSSVNFSARKYLYPYLVYFNKVKTSKTFIRDATMVQGYALLLFSGERHNLRIIEAADDGKESNNSEVFGKDQKITKKKFVFVCLNGWMRFKAKLQVAKIIIKLREELDTVLAMKIDLPFIDITLSPVVNAILRLLQSDGLDYDCI